MFKVKRDCSTNNDESVIFPNLHLRLRKRRGCVGRDPEKLEIFLNGELVWDGKGGTQVRSDWDLGM